MGDNDNNDNDNDNNRTLKSLFTPQKDEMETKRRTRKKNTGLRDDE